MADKRIIEDGNLSGTAGRSSLKDILKRLGPIKDMSDEEYRIYLRSQYNEKTGKKKGGVHAPGPDLGTDIDAQVKKRREKINKGNKENKIINEFVGISGKTPKKKPVKKEEELARKRGKKNKKQVERNNMRDLGTFPLTLKGLDEGFNQFRLEKAWSKPKKKPVKKAKGGMMTKWQAKWG